MADESASPIPAPAAREDAQTEASGMRAGDAAGAADPRPPALGEGAEAGSSNAATAAAAAASDRGGAADDDRIGALLERAQQALREVEEPARPAATPYEWKELRPDGGDGAPAVLELLNDVELNIQIELGRTQMLIEDVLRLREGSVVALDKLAGDPVDIVVNGRKIGRGEVVVLNDNFCVRVAEIFEAGNEPS